jgi:branched-chain amino acid transport system permease protein
VFNFAQGAIGMLMAFLYWQLHVDQHWPTPLCLLLVLGVAAPLFGAACDLLIMRRIHHAPVVHQVTVTVGLMLALMGIAGLLWPGAAASRALPPFFAGEGVRIADVVISWHRMISVAVAATVSVLLRLLLFRTRFGVAMRACVDDRDLAALHGARPQRASMAAWALGSSMAALAGILLAPEIPFSIAPLTLLIIDAFAAAILGRLRSLPLTFAGGLLLGLLNAYAITFLDLNGRWSAARAAIPTVFLFIVLLALPRARISAAGRENLPPVPASPNAARRTATALAALVAFAVLAATVLPEVQVGRLTLGIITALIMLSLVPLTGWAGEISLAPMTFAGLGAFAMATIADRHGLLLGLAAGTLIAVPAGLAMAAPAVRLHGLYMALASLAFARMADLLLFPQPELFGESSSGTLTIAHRTLDTWHVASPRVLLPVATTVFAAVATALAALRTRRYGRRLLALRDSPVACETLGIDTRRTKLSVYALSSAIAGLAGALLAVHRGQVTAGDFSLLASLPIVLLLAVAGITTISGALIAGLLSVAFLLAQTTWNLSLVQTLTVLGPGLAALSIAYNPRGIAPAVAAFLTPPRPTRPAGPPTAPLTATDDHLLQTADDALLLPEEARHDAPRS